MKKLNIDKKTIYWAVGGTLAAVALYLLLTWIFAKLKNTARNIELTQEANAEIDTKLLTATTAQYNVIASKLQTAFYSGLWGMTEDEDAIYDAFNMLSSRSDVLQLEKIFGVYKGKTLREHIQTLLSQAEIAHINEILASKNINYKY